MGIALAELASLFPSYTFTAGLMKRAFRRNPTHLRKALFYLGEFRPYRKSRPRAAHQSRGERMAGIRNCRSFSTGSRVQGSSRTPRKRRKPRPAMKPPRAAGRPRRGAKVKKYAPLLRMQAAKTIQTIRTAVTTMAVMTAMTAPTIMSVPQ